MKILNKISKIINIKLKSLILFFSFLILGSLFSSYQEANKNERPIQEGGESLYLLATLYKEGLGVPKDLAKAREYYLKAAKKDHYEAWLAFNELQIAYELEKPNVSNVIRPIDIVDYGKKYLKYNNEKLNDNSDSNNNINSDCSLDNIKPEPFCFGLPYKIKDNISNNNSGLVNTRNLELLWLYNIAGNQSYLNLRSQFISELSKIILPKIKEKILSKTDYNEIFETFIKHLKKIGKKRQEIAYAQNTPHPEEFGLLRSEIDKKVNGRSFTVLYTPLSPEDPKQGRYQPWAREVKETVFNHISLLLDNPELSETPWILDAHNKGNDDSKEKKKIQSRMRIRLLKKGELQHSTIAKDLQKFCIEWYPQHYTDFKKEDFKKNNIQYLQLEIEIGFQNNENGEITFIPCTTITGIYKKDTIQPNITNNGTNINNDVLRDNSNKFTRRSLSYYLVGPLVATHPHKKNLPALLKMASTCWTDALLFEKKNSKNSSELSELIDKIATVQYILDHVSAFSRGSGAISEFVAESLFRMHGYEVSLAPQTISLVQTALGTSLSEFRKRYPKMVRVQLIDH